MAGTTADSSPAPVFEMIYERNPVRCKFERRLEVNTSPLNIIYNPQAIKKVTEFFYKGRVHPSGEPSHRLFFTPWLQAKMSSHGFCVAKMLIGFPGFGYQSELELRVAEAARRQYNKLKMQ